VSSCLVLDSSGMEVILLAGGVRACRKTGVIMGNDLNLAGALGARND